MRTILFIAIVAAIVALVGWEAYDRGGRSPKPQVELAPSSALPSEPHPKSHHHRPKERDPKFADRDFWTNGPGNALRYRLCSVSRGRNHV